MVRGKPLSTELRGRIIAYAENGMSMKAIADRVGIPKATIGVTIKKFKERGHNSTLPKSGRPRKWKPRDDRLIVREALKRPFLSWRELSSELNGVPVGQLKKTAYRNGVYRRIALRKPYSTARHKRKGLPNGRDAHDLV